MTEIKKQFGLYELDGKVYGPVRIGLKSKLQYERTAKQRKWDAETEPMHAITFWIWHAAKERGLHELSFDEFIEQVEDVQTDDSDDADDPTVAADTAAP